LNIKPNILVCPLDWGLGHASRCIPVIRSLLLRNANVLIAGSGNSIELLKAEFPELHFILFEGYNVRYSAKGRMVSWMLYKLPSFISKIFREHRKLKKIITEYNIDAVISDNRYGLFTKRLPSVFITHQLMIKCHGLLKFLEPLLYLVNNFFISKYAECWVPDYSGKINLSADLSHKYHRLGNVRYIGPLSRFYDREDIDAGNTIIFELMVILSGPEPQRHIIENKILGQLKELNIKAIVVLGKTGAFYEEKLGEKVNVYSYLKADEQLKFMKQSELILCRSGYSSIMDLCALGKKAILVPTPGQTEQEYLARNFNKKKVFFSQDQHSFDLCAAIMKSEKYNGIKIKNNPSLLNKRIDMLLNRIRNSKSK
jgi:uncharacterized protein (TIGR00661 family)